MKESNVLIGNLKDRFNSLVFLYEKSQADKKLISEENFILKERLKKQESSYEELKKKHETISLAKAFTTSGEDTHEAKIKVNKIVREIDNCIALLNR